MATNIIGNKHQEEIFNYKKKRKRDQENIFICMGKVSDLIVNVERTITIRKRKRAYNYLIFL